MKPFRLRQKTEEVRLGRPGETRIEKLQYLLSVRSVSWQCGTQGSVEGILPMSRMALGLILPV